MYEQQYKFAIEGITPLLMHWDNIEWADLIEAKRSQIKKEDKKLFKAGDDRCPPSTWKGSVYTDGTHIAIPNDLLRSCLMRGAAKVELKGKETFKRLSQSGIWFEDLFYPLVVNGKLIKIADVEAIEGVFSEHVAAVKALGFQLLAKRAVIGTNKHVRVRPQFREWATEGILTVVDEQVTFDVLKEIWRIAGLRMGLGDWRPGAPRSPGPYGRFKVELSVV